MRLLKLFIHGLAAAPGLCAAAAVVGSRSPSTGLAAVRPVEGRGDDAAKVDGHDATYTLEVNKQTKDGDGGKWVMNKNVQDKLTRRLKRELNGKAGKTWSMHAAASIRKLNMRALVDWNVYIAGSLKSDDGPTELSSVETNGIGKKDAADVLKMVFNSYKEQGEGVSTFEAIIKVEPKKESTKEHDVRVRITAWKGKYA